MRHAVIALALLAVCGCDSNITLTAPQRPERLYAVSAPYGVDVYWDGIPGASGYRVYRRSSETDDYDLATEVTGTFASVGFRSSPPESEVMVAVAALRGNAESAKSPPVYGLRQPDHLSPYPVLAIRSTSDGFGTAIAGVGDLDDDGREDVLVGAPGAAGGAGAVHLFLGTSGGLVAEPVLTIMGAGGSSFGRSISYSDSYDAGNPAVVIGAPGGLGAASVYRPGNDPLLTHLVDLPAPVQALSASFGAVVLAAGNLDGLVPVVGEIAVSAPAASGGEGRVYVFPGFGTDSEQAEAAPIEVRMEVPNAAAGFGFSLAAVGNLDTDPADDLLIGAPFHFDFGGVAVLDGSVNLFEGTAATVVFDYMGTDLGGGLFGWSMASIGDPDSDDRDELVIGAPNDDCDGANEGAGAVFIINPGGGAPTRDCGEAGDQHFGYALAFAGPVFDGVPEQFLVGSYTDIGNGRSTGSWATAWSDFDPDEAPPELDFFNPEGNAAPGFGRVLASADVNGDQRPDVLVGDPVTRTVHLYVTIPEHGPEVLLGGPLETTEGATVTLFDAFIADTAATTYSCTIDWGDELGTGPVNEPCTIEELREFSNSYAITDPARDGSQDFFVSVSILATDGRSGMGVTRVRVRP